jgi:hypothetical protein
MSVRALLLVVASLHACAFWLPTSLFGQDPPNFTTVINVPPDAPIPIGSSTQLNLRDGGELPFGFAATDGGELNMSGGRIVGDFIAGPGSVVNISGGIVGMSFDAQSGSVVNISGGAIGPDFDALFGSDVELIGGEFRLNGTEFSGSKITLTSDDVFTGTLADGSTFVFSPADAEILEGVTLTTTTLPALDTTPIVVDGSSTVKPTGLRAGQTLTLRDGGALSENFAIVDATLDIEGGTVANALDVAGGTVNMQRGSVGRLFAFSGSVINVSGGTVADESRAYAGSKVNMRGGSVGRRFDANSGSVVNISGGSVGDSFRAYPGSETNIRGGSVGIDFLAHSGSIVNISGGSVGGSFEAVFGSEVNLSGGSIGALSSAASLNMSGGALGREFAASKAVISGGIIGRQFRALFGSNVELIGGEFRLNGADFTGDTISLNLADVFTGTLADGTPFLFSWLSGDNLNGVKLTAESLPPLDTTPITVDAANSVAPLGLRRGQSLTLRGSGALGNDFAAVEGTLDIEGGTVGTGLEVADSVVNLHRGSIGENFEANSGSLVNILGGSVGINFNANAGTVVNIRGGRVGVGFAASADSVVNISGGSFGESFGASSGSEINLFGTRFVLDGVPLDALPINQAVTITDRDVTLSGRLADGSQFSFFMLTRGGFFSPDAKLTVTRVDVVPEPSFLALMAATGLAVVGIRWRRASQCDAHEQNTTRRAT